MKNNLFAEKTLLITGGTGSFGNEVLRQFITTNIGEIRVFSRDEKKQDDLRHQLYDEFPFFCDKIKFYIGDVRDYSSVINAVQGVDFIFHAAALKQVPSCEFFPMEAVKTNILGTDNVLNAGVTSGVSKIICLSTDKAAYPINAMGTSKAMMEKLVLARSRTVDESRTKICCTRYGNVLASRGSVLPVWVEQLKKGKKLTITDPKMTRFIMTLEESISLVLFAFENGENGDLFVQKAPSCTIVTMAHALLDIFRIEHDRIDILGIRHGEKLYETLLTNEECFSSIDLGEFYRVPSDKRELNYAKYFFEGEDSRDSNLEFNSNNADLLSLDAVKEKLLSLNFIKEELKRYKV